MEFFAPNFAFLDKNCVTKRKFSDSPKFNGGYAPSLI